MCRSEAGERARADSGYVTAEAAVVVPALVLFTMALIWALMATSAQIQCVDAARAGARAAARQEPAGASVAAARQAAPRGARVTIGREGDLVRVTVEAPSPGLGALSLTLRAEAVAAAEESVGVAA
ncbi:TadE family type IV pilus minor pilin [Streptomyces sp. ISL-100]|uniref:TadE family type IV pilus minor pilin n=1 Tax=Streptomyces sp. ISL-100 TaxID=2819173 RepID=UPI001BE8FE57|nr:TadE family type IV pilus minor pilin [Streptomyces sp. ISL-100]MBT2399283.1 pilus assembly protein [Streptomyces sp. ISL-100]